MKESTLFEKFCSIKRSRRFSKIFIVRALIVKRSRFRFFVGIVVSTDARRKFAIYACNRAKEFQMGHFTLRWKLTLEKQKLEQFKTRPPTEQLSTRQQLILEVG